MNETQPVFQQIMEIIENDIIAGTYKTDDLIISTTQIAKLYSVNPSTAVKAISKLTDMGMLYKKKGIGMCVAEGAREQIVIRRRETFLNATIDSLLSEAATLGVTVDEVIQIIKERGTLPDD